MALTKLNTRSGIDLSSYATSTDLSNLTTGKVLQVVQTQYVAETITTSTSWVDTGLSATITPSSTSSKIAVLVHQSGIEKRSSDTVIHIRLLSNLADLGNFTVGACWTANSNPIRVAGAGINLLNSPNTTSPVTYKTMQINASGSADVRTQSGGSVSTMMLMEIAG